MDDFLETAKRYRRELLAAYHGYEYVPMGVAHAVPIPVTVGCDYNACLFCDLNQGLPYRVFSREEIQESIRKTAFLHQQDRHPPTTAVLLQGNPFGISADLLLEVAALLRKELPSITAIRCFARSQDVLKKSQAELRQLRAAGYDHLTLGIESGSDTVLAFHHKGVTAAAQEEAMHRLEAADIAYDCYLMLGLGGRVWSEEHIRQTAAQMNRVHPRMLIVVTLVLFKHAPLLRYVRSGTFQRLPPLASMEEECHLLEQLTLNCQYNGSHKTNMFPLRGRLPEQKDLLLGTLQTAIARAKHDPTGLGLAENRRWRHGE